MKRLAVLQSEDAAVSDLFREPPLNRLPNEAWRVGAVELIDRDDTRRRGDVDLGQPFAADHVDPGKDDAALLELGTKGGADFLFACRDLGLRRFPADRKIGTDLALARH